MSIQLISGWLVLRVLAHPTLSNLSTYNLCRNEIEIGIISVRNRHQNQLNCVIDSGNKVIHPNSGQFTQICGHIRFTKIIDR